jgi:iron(III) transport system permease protein
MGQPAVIQAGACRPTISFLIWIAILLFIVAFSAAPLAWMMTHAAADDISSLASNSDHAWLLLFRTIAFAAAVAGLAAILGTIAGYGLGTTTWPGKNIARLVLLLPLVIPPYLHALGWTTLLRPNGYFSIWLSRTANTLPTFASDKIYSFPGAVMILAFAYFPIAMLFTEKSLAWSSLSLVEAAQMLGAGRWQTFRVARWPFIWPAVLSATAIIFLLSASELGVPTILKIPVFNFEVFIQISVFYDVNAAVLLSTPLLLLGFFVIGTERRLTSVGRLRLDVQDVNRPPPASKRQSIILFTFFFVLSVVTVALPMGAILIETASTVALRKTAPLAWRPALNSIYYAMSAATIITIASFLLAWSMRNASRWQHRLTDALLVVGFAVPSTIVGLALLACYDRPVWTPWISPTTLVIAALVVRYTIVGHRIIATAVDQIPKELLEAAALVGAGEVRTICYLILPMLRTSMLAAFLVSIILAIAETGSTILLYPPGGETLLIALYAIEANSPRAYVSAMGLFQLLVAIIPYLLLLALVQVARKP